MRNGDRVEFFRPDTLGVIGFGTVVKVGRKYLHVETIHGRYRIHPRHVTTQNGVTA